MAVKIRHVPEDVTDGVSLANGNMSGVTRQRLSSLGVAFIAVGAVDRTQLRNCRVEISSRDSYSIRLATNTLNFGDVHEGILETETTATLARRASSGTPSHLRLGSLKRSRLREQPFTIYAPPLIVVASSENSASRDPLRGVHPSAIRPKRWNVVDAP